MSPRARRQTQTATIPMAPTEPVATASVANDSRAHDSSRMARISERAYAIYQRRGGQDGQELEDWLQAEREIDAEA